MGRIDEILKERAKEKRIRKGKIRLKIEAEKKKKEVKK